MVDISRRQSFADVLENLAEGKFAPGDYECREYMVNHYYHDELLEEYRRKCVSLSIEKGNSFARIQEHKDQLRRWAKELVANRKA